MKVYPPAATVDEALMTRRSVRAFLPTPVSRETIEEILSLASRAPSGNNIQPWKVTVLAGEAREALSRRIAEVRADPERMAGQDEGYAYYPRTWVSPYLERRRKFGWSLYGLLGIGRGDKAAMEAQMGRNYDFFGAPVGLIFTIDRIMEQGSWLDYEHVPAKRDAGREGPRAGHLPAGGLYLFPPADRRFSRDGPGEDGGGLRHGPGLCRPRGGGKPAGDRAGAGIRFRGFRR